MTELATPYLSVVVTTRNDDHGGDPLQRLQAFVNTFDEQCRRTGLDAEVIVVEWNPPADRPRVSEMLRLPVRPRCTYRFLEVPPELHNRFKLAEVLPLFQMIAKNVGIRRARGRFVVATNVDIIFSTELVEYLASRTLQAGHLYRVDRHDIQSHVPVNGRLEEQMTFCTSNQLRVHTRSGSLPVAPDGQPVLQPEDIVDGESVRLGGGWHMRESAGRGQIFRWAGEVATLRLDPAVAGHRGESVLHVEIESNPYDADSEVDIEIAEGAAVLRTLRVKGRRCIALPMRTPERSGPREIALRVTHAQPDWRARLPIFERREAMHYRVYSAALSAAVPGPSLFDYALEGWQNANPGSGLTMTPNEQGLAVVSDRAKGSYCVRYGPLRAPRRGMYRFELASTTHDGRFTAGIFGGSDRFRIPSTVKRSGESGYGHLEISVALLSNEECSVVIYNDHPQGEGVSRFVIHELRGTCDPVRTRANPRPRVFGSWLQERRAVAYGGLMSCMQKLRDIDTRRRGWNAVAEPVAQVISALVGKGVRYRIARRSPEYRRLEAMLHGSDAEVQRLAPLQDLAEMHRFLGENRPDNLHVNACGDFQLMAREHWHELRGYPEFETFSMNIDGLLSYIGDAAGIREEMLTMPIYHLEHAIGSGWSPEGEAILRRRIAERGITWVDASTVYIWAAYMRWLGRPMIFNGSDWGMANAQLAERAPSEPPASQPDYVRHRR